MALNLKRKKTASNEKWDITLGGAVVGSMKAVHKTEFQRTMRGSVRVRLTNGSSKSATVHDSKSFRKLLVALNRELGLNPSQVRTPTVSAAAKPKKAPAKKTAPKKKTPARKATSRKRTPTAKPATTPAAALAPAAPQTPA